MLSLLKRTQCEHLHCGDTSQSRLNHLESTFQNQVHKTIVHAEPHAESQKGLKGIPIAASGSSSHQKHLTHSSDILRCFCGMSSSLTHTAYLQKARLSQC